MPNRREPESGGIGDRPVILAGRLRRRTSRERLWEQAAAGVDSHTGVEDRSGRKSREKVHKSLSEANEA